MEDYNLKIQKYFLALKKLHEILSKGESVPISMFCKKNKLHLKTGDALRKGGVIKCHRPGPNPQWEWNSIPPTREMAIETLNRIERLHKTENRPIKQIVVKEQKGYNDSFTLKGSIWADTKSGELLDKYGIASFGVIRMIDIFFTGAPPNLYSVPKEIDIKYLSNYFGVNENYLYEIIKYLLDNEIVTPKNYNNWQTLLFLRCHYDDCWF